MIRFLWAAFLSAALAAQVRAPAGGEIATREETPVFQSRVNLVRVPVVVRDRHGKAVGNLTKEDFRLFDKGKPQAVALFAMEGSAAPKTVPTTALASSKEADLPAPSETGKPPAVLPTRFIAYVFDDLNLEPTDLMQARQAAIKHMEHALRPQDRAAVFALSGRTETPFTDDRAVLDAAMRKIIPAPHNTGNPPLGYYHSELIEELGDGNPDNEPFAVAVQEVIEMGVEPHIAPSVARVAAREAQRAGHNDSRNSLLMLKTLVNRMAAMPGDRIVILISSGFYVTEDLHTELTEVFERAARSNVIINTLDARGVYVVPEERNPGLRRIREQEGVVKTLTLNEIAASTGGTAFRGSNDLFGGFNSLAAPPEYIYYLGFYSDAKPDGSFHALKVTLRDSKGLTLKAREGYWAPPRTEDQVAQAGREIREAVFSRDEVHDLPVGVRTRLVKTGDGGVRLEVVAHLDLQAVHFHKEAEENRDDVTLVCALFDRSGNYLMGTQKIVEMRLRDEELQERLRSGVDIGSEFDIKAGTYMIRVVVRDGGGRQVAALNASAEIP